MRADLSQENSTKAAEPKLPRAGLRVPAGQRHESRLVDSFEGFDAYGGLDMWSKMPACCCLLYNFRIGGECWDMRLSEVSGKVSAKTSSKEKRKDN